MLDPLEFGIANEILTRNYLRIFAVSFLYYDHLITSGNEIEYLWKRPKTPSAYWFFATRYFAFFGNIVVTVMGYTLVWKSNYSDVYKSFILYSCRQYLLFRHLMLLINQVLVCILLTLRVYALYGCSFRVLLFMVGSGSLLLVAACWSFFSQKTELTEDLPPGCHVGYDGETAISLATAWEALFLYDFIIFTLTMAKTWKGRHDHGITRISAPVVRLVCRDGAIYFAVMGIANLANILTFYFSGPFMVGGLSTFASCISVTMVSRLILNLHKSAAVGITPIRAIPFTNTNVEYSSPSNIVELDTLYSGDLRFNPTIRTTLSDDDPLQFRATSLSSLSF